MKERNFARRYKSEFNWYKQIVQYYAVYCVCGAFWSLFYRIKIEGRENIPKTGKIIPAANHISYFDPFLVFRAVRKPTAFMAKKELFERSAKNTLLSKILDNWRIGWLDRLGAFSVNREKLEVSTIKTAKDALSTKNWTLGIFPQGGIRKNKKIENANKGFAVFSRMTKYDILPIGITGCESYNWDFWNKRTINIRIGKPISHELELDELLDQWAHAVADLCEYECALEIEKEAVAN